MNIFKEYHYTNDRQLWRLLPTDTGKIVIEDRNTETKEVFFNCLDIQSGVTIFQNVQLEEKFWIGIEEIKDDIIFFHKFAKPDMPGHKGIIAFDINLKEIIWQNEEYNFLFIKEGKIYCYVQRFEGRDFYTVDMQSGIQLEELEESAEQINLLREETFIEDSYQGYYFPEIYPSGFEEGVNSILADFKENHVIGGRIEFVKYGENLLLFNYHEVNADNTFTNKFNAVNLFSGETIFEEILNKSSNAFVPDSFFVKDDLIFLLIEKKQLTVCSIKE